MATAKKSTPKKSPANGKPDPCWEGYEKIGMKMKKGKLVPNCVPIKKTAKKKSAKKSVTKKSAKSKSSS